MDWLEHELKHALARKEPSPEATRAFLSVARRRRPIPRWIAAAAAVVVLAGGGEAYRWHRGMEAKRQVMEAMRLTANKLNHIQARLKEVRP